MTESKSEHEQDKIKVITYDNADESIQDSNIVKVSKQVEATNDIVAHAASIRSKLRKQIEENRKVYI